MNIYLIRHARQNSKLCNVNVELSTKGYVQADLLGKRIKNYDIDAIYASNLIRAVETANAINKYVKKEIIIREDLREISFGDMEGHTDEFIMEEFKAFKSEQDKLVSDIPYPSGENGEMVCDRAFPIILEIANSGYENVAVVTHGGVIRSLLTKVLGTDYANKFLFCSSLENTSITELTFVKEKNRFYLQRLNDYSHLEHRELLLRKYF